MLKNVRKKIDKRLDYLKCCDNLDEGDMPMTFASEMDFLKFMESREKLDKPLIALLPSGNICAEWHDGVDVLLEFEGKNKIDFCVIFTGKRSNVNGVLSVGKIRKVFDALDIWKNMLV